MASKAFSQSAFTDPNLSSENFSEADGRKFHKANVYDAVAGNPNTYHNNVEIFNNTLLGKISSAGFIPKYLVYSSTRDTPSSSAKAVAPEAVLFKLKNAPTRYEESDIYFANERNCVTNLPDPDLLKALHCYVSDFYSSAIAGGREGDWRSMDETALLAMGILMEEAARESLGQTGDLAFTEGEETLAAGSNNTHETRSDSKGRSSKRRRV